MLAKNQSIKKLIVEVDALAIVNLISFENIERNSTHPYNAIIINCRSLLRHFEEARVKHVHRKANHCADLLAKEGFNTPIGLFVHPHPPSCILYQLLADSWGVVYPRLCNLLYTVFGWGDNKEDGKQMEEIRVENSVFYCLAKEGKC